MRLMLCLLLGIVPGLGGTIFLPPDDSRVLFRRDLLPVDPDTMRVLSQLLTELARRPVAGDPAQVRATSQLLALATRLDPANRPARDLGRRLAEGAVPPAPNQRVLSRSLAETWHIVSWLLHDEAGAEGQRLGHLLVDALRVIDPQHPSAGRHDAAGEAVRWKGVVAAVDRFTRAEPSVPAPEPPPPAAAPPEEPAAPGPAPAAVRLTQATLHTPIYTYNKDYEQHLEVVPVTMSIQDDAEAGALAMALVPTFESPLLEGMQIAVGASLRKAWPVLPRGKRALFVTNDERYASRNGGALSGPMALLLHAALAGRDLRPDLHFIGEIDARGRLGTPRHGWELLQGLRRGKGGLLLVPPDFQRELEALLVLGDPGFFLKYEVLAAPSLEAALALGGTGDSPEDLAEAFVLFETVRAAGAKTPVGQLAVNKIFRARLESIRAKAPGHLSASLLLLQGSAQRPKRLDSTIFALDVAQTLDSIAWVARSDPRSLEPAKVEAAWTKARRRLDALQKLIERKDAALHQSAVTVVDTLRTMARSRRLDAAGKSDFHEKQLYQSHLALKDGLDRLRARLAPFTGDAVPEVPAPPPPPAEDPKKRKNPPRRS